MHPFAGAKKKGGMSQEEGDTLNYKTKNVFDVKKREDLNEGPVPMFTDLNTSLAAPGALAHRLQRRTAR